jgi:hypothetical protein
MRVLLAILMALVWIDGASAQSAKSVSVVKGNIVIDIGGQRRMLTRLGRDADPALSPDGTFVVFTRTDGKPPSDDPMECKTGLPGDQLRRIAIDGAGDRLLVAARAGDKPPQQLCGFDRKQFSADGRRLYFLSPAWTTSSALHVYDFTARSVSFVAPANDLVVLSFCKGEHRDQLLLNQHRYFIGGGSYDWYWLFDRAGRKEIGPVGTDADTHEAIVEKARDMICAQ